jgi:branched-chain amino acid transport system permease protein
MAFWASFNYLIFWIAGGSYSFIGPAVGAIALTVIPEFLRFSLSERYILYGIVLVALILLRPRGLIQRIPVGSKLSVRRLLGVGS